MVGPVSVRFTMEVGEVSSIESRKLEGATGTLGFVASLVCGIHCMAWPAFTATLLVAGISLPMQASLELALIGASFLLAIVTFLPSALSGKSPFALQSAALALGFFLLGWKMNSLSELLRQSFTVSASAMLLVAHGYNLWRLRSRACKSGGSLHACQPSA
jgi:hypothetical protein